MDFNLINNLICTFRLIPERKLSIVHDYSTGSWEIVMSGFMIIFWPIVFNQYDTNSLLNAQKIATLKWRGVVTLHITVNQSQTEHFECKFRNCHKNQWNWFLLHCCNCQLPFGTVNCFILPCSLFDVYLFHLVPNKFTVIGCCWQ